LIQIKSEFKIIFSEFSDLKIALLIKFEI
jgi:hypothetical protein